MRLMIFWGINRARILRDRIRSMGEDRVKERDGMEWEGMGDGSRKEKIDWME